MTILSQSERGNSGEVAKLLLYRAIFLLYKNDRYMLVVPTGGTSWHPDATLDSKEVIPSIVSLLREPPVISPELIDSNPGSQPSGMI